MPVLTERTLKDQAHELVNILEDLQYQDVRFDSMPDGMINFVWDEVFTQGSFWEESQWSRLSEADQEVIIREAISLMGYSYD